MRLLPFILLMFVCIVAGTQEPLFFLGAYVLFVWIAVALFARAVRWLIRPIGAAAGGGSRKYCPSGAGREMLPGGWSAYSSGGQGSGSAEAGGPPRASRVRVCPDDRCGRVNAGQARFCAQCGRRLA